MSNKDGVVRSGFGAKLVCECGKGKVYRDDRIAAGVVTGGAKHGGAIDGDRVSGPGVRGEERGVEKITSDASFRLS